MKKDKVCPYCNEVFENVEGRVFSNHVRWCKQNPVNYRSEEKISNIKKSMKRMYESKNGKIKEFEVICEKCKTKFIVYEPEFKFPLKEKYYCSRSCANCREHDSITKNKIRNSINSYNDHNGLSANEITFVCPECKKPFKSKRKDRKYCSKKCSDKSKIKDMSSLKSYRNLCKFKFSLKDYPDEFDFEILKEHGMYSPTNKKNNISGVSRDHMVSVKYGFEHGIDPEIISHPANCRLILHSNNVKKYDSCSITLNELLKRIEEWDKKYVIMGP